MVNLCLFVQSGEENVLNSFLSKVLVPVLDKLFAQVICFVDQQDELLFPLAFLNAHLADIFLKIG